MKKFLIISTLLISTIFFADNVSAKSVTVNTDLFGDIVIDTDQIAEKLDLDITENFVLAKRKNGTDVILLLERKDTYISFTYNDTFSMGLLNKDTFELTNNLVLLYDNTTKDFTLFNTDVIVFNINYNEIYYNSYIEQNFFVNSSPWYKGFIKFDPILKQVYAKSYNDSDYKLLFTYEKDYFSLMIKFDILYFVESDIENFYYPNTCIQNSQSFDCFSNVNGITNNNIFRTYYYDLDSYILDSNIPYGRFSDIQGTILSNTDIYSTSNNSLLFNKNISNNILPTISIKKESETTVTIENNTYISSITLDVEFSLIDNEKYLYMYKYGSNSEWSTITLSNSTSLSLTYNYNDTLYSQVVDRETNEIVSSTTYTVSSINYNFMPYVDVTENTPSSCFFYKNGRNYTICKDINIVAKNLEDGNFIASYSYDSINWVNFENTTISLNENTIIYFRITNYLTNEISYISSYTVSSIDTDISDLGVFNTYSSIYNKDTSFITAYINIYNLVEPIQDNYKIYYSTNSTSFIDITLLLTDMTNYYQYEINNINENKTIYFRITDLNDNILYTSSYSINYQIQANENSNFFTSFRTNFHGLSDIISTPLYAIKKLNIGVCSPLVIPIPYTNTTISLPCMTTFYQNNIPDILNIWQIVTNGIISYYIILDLFRIVKSFKEPEEDKIEVVDL